MQQHYDRQASRTGKSNSWVACDIITRVPLVNRASPHFVALESRNKQGKRALFTLADQKQSWKGDYGGAI